ncbi:MAG: hypothetical protein WBW84_08565 [Acidobacteriaceae bacterium]
MRVAGAISFAILLILSLSTPRAAAQDLPACNAHLMTRHGNEITIGLQQLSDLFNQKLNGAHSHFSDLHLTVESGRTLKVSLRKNGTPISISGPLRPVSSGAVKLHARHIQRNGHHEKGLMDLFGRNLADYAHFSKTQTLSANKNNLYIHPDPIPIRC